MPNERFPKQEEKQRTGGQHGTRNIGNVETEQAKRRARHESQRPGREGSKDQGSEQGT